MHTKLSNQLKKVLTEGELKRLLELKKATDPDLGQLGLRSFFHDPIIFDKVKTIYDPTWLAYDIFINRHLYEF